MGFGFRVWRLTSHQLALYESRNSRQEHKVPKPEEEEEEEDEEEEEEEEEGDDFGLGVRSSLNPEP